MSLKPAPIPPVPEETARVARAVYPKGSVAMQLRDELGSLYTDDQFADRFPTHGQPAEAPWRLALVTVLQFMEHLSDRQAAEAVRRCLDWKYCLSLELTDLGFDHSVLSEFRTRLVEGRPNCGCWSCSWSAVGRGAGSKHGGGNGRTRRVSWPRSERSIGSGVSPRPWSTC